MTRSRRECRARIARGALALAAVLLLPLAAALQAPRESAAQSAAEDSLWAWSASGIGACADPSSAAALATCFTSQVSQQEVGVAAMATDGDNVYFAGKRGGLSCPVADLDASCTRIMAGPWGDGTGNLVISLAAANGQIWIGQNNGQIYRCPANLPYIAQDTAPPQCVLLDDAGDRAVNSLLLANGRLYAGLGTYKKQGLLWTCSPDAVNACSTLDSYGDTTTDSLAAGGGYLWAGLANGIIWRCDLNAANACADWETAGTKVTSISYDGQGTLYAATEQTTALPNGVIWSCPTADANGCSTVLPNVNGVSVAAGAGSVFSSLNQASGYVLHFGSSPFTAANRADWNWSHLLYVPADGLIGVGGVEVTMSAESPGSKLARRCAGPGKAPRATVTLEGPDGFEKTQKTSICGMKQGGSVSETVDLLDPGDYTVTVRAGKWSGWASVTVEQDMTSPVSVELARDSSGG